MRKKIISSILTLALISESTVSVYASDWFEGYESGAKPRQWTDGGGGKYFYGGEITYRFKRNTAFKPILEVRPPGIQAGCHGLSISGGFIHFLGLDEIKEQLQSASEGAMMGVVVGLVYSMPSLADAFDKVQKYVRMLQQILSQSCQISAMATKNWIDAQRKAAREDAGNGYENVVGEVMNNLNGDWPDSINKGTEYLKEQIIGKPDTATKAKQTPAMKAALLCNQTCMISRKNASTEIKSFVQSKGGGKVYAEGSINDISSVITNDEQRRNILFSIVFMGYYATTDFPTEQSINDWSANMVNEMSTGGKAIPSPKFERGLFFSGANIKGASAARILLYGPDDGSGSLKLPNIKMVPFYSERSQQSGGQTTYSDISYGVLYGTKDTSSAPDGFVFPWNGLVKDGTDYLRERVILGTVTMYPTVPSVLPGMSKYINVLRTLYRQTGNEAYVMSLVDMLAKKNAVMLLQSMVYEMQSSLMQGGAKDPEAMAAIDAIYKELDRMNSSDSSIADTISIFEKLEREHDQTITGNVRGK